MLKGKLNEDYVKRLVNELERFPSFSFTAVLCKRE